MSDWRETERCRITVAYEIGVPPDDILLQPIFDMIEISRIRETESEENDFNIVLIPETKDHEEAILNKHSDMIINKIFTCETPFEGYLYGVLRDRGKI